MKIATTLGLVALAMTIPASASAHGGGSDEAVGHYEGHANGLYRLRTDDGAVLYTHGGDAKRSHGPDMNVGDPEVAPVCATDYYQHVLYGRSRRAADRYGSVKASLQAQIRRNTAVLDESARVSGGSGARYKVACDSGGIAVGNFTVKSGSTDFNTIVSAARQAGFNRSNVDYTIFFDGVSRTACGVGSYYSDETGGAGNLNNNGGGYAVSYADCWYGRTSMHENGHNQGAVQPGAPHSTGTGGHCNDLLDVMCYAPDGGNQNQKEVTLCSTVIWFDCNFDTYFDAAPEGTEWLSTHWNIGAGYNRFISFP
jgi:hypothetical protein